MRTRLATVLTVLLLAAAALPARAQYFGQNKVRYESPRFQVLKTAHFDIYYEEDQSALIEDVGAMAERWYDRLSRVLDHQLSRRQPLLLYSSHPGFEQTNAIPGELGESVGGVTESFKRRIVMPLAGSIAETDHVLGHELVHAFQYDLSGAGRAGGLVSGGIERLPLWFVEGMAEYLSVGAEDPHTAMWMRDALASKKLPNYGRLSDPRYFPYRFGQALFAFVAARHGESAVARMLKGAAGSGDPSTAFRGVLATSPDSLIDEWHAAIRDWGDTILAVTQAPAKQGTPVVVEKREMGRLNLAPAISPDGRKLVFLSERGRFSIEMYVADAVTGRIERQITKTVVDPHFQSLQFIASSGDWAPDNRRFAFTAVSRGRPLLSILDTGTGRTVREHRFDDLGEVLTPSWSPDGSRIVFSALARGVTDLWIVDVASGERRRLTNDRHADLQPAWSPDGKTIAFVTDRFAAGSGGATGTNGDSTATGPGFVPGRDDYALALIEVAGGAIRRVPGFAAAKHVDPHWSADGGSLFFVSDRGGISDLYRVALPGGELRQLTRLNTGVSGITALSPAVTVARDAERLIFSAYEKGSYNLYRLEGAAALAGAELSPAAGPRAGVLPPADDETISRREALHAPTSPPRPERASYERSPYRARLSLDNVTQASLGVGGGSTGTRLSGGAVFLWSDMLGDHNLVTALQFLNAGGNFLNNTGALAAYTNLKSRWNWGVELSQIPYIVSTFTEEFGTINGSIPAVRQIETRYWQIDRSLLGQVFYPFSRFRRVELTGGLRNIAFAQEQQTRIVDVNGAVYLDSTAKQPSDPSLNLATAGAAMVFDNSVFGGTSPVLGRRYRVSVEPVFGTLNFTEVLGDIRQYVSLRRPLTLAGRVLHFGRYGGDGEDGRLTPLFVGYPSLVRGYDIGSFTSEQPIFDELLGSKLAVANLELRLPLLGTLGVIPSPAVPPLELAAFFDAGSAWTGNLRPSFLGGDARTVTSHGLAMRLNLFGFAIGEVDFVHPNDRTDKSWYWLFSIQPGF
jgi:hypothetical protein